MPVAKILNLWDRSIGFALMTMFAVLGLIMSACCYDIGTYCAAQVFDICVQGPVAGWLAT